MGGGQLLGRDDGCIPRVEGKIERAPVDGHPRAPFYETVHFERALGAEMNFAPCPVVGSRFDQRQIERAELCADVSRSVEEAGIAGKPRPRVFANKRPRRPQRRICAGRGPSAEVARRRGVNFESADLGVFPPVELDDTRGIDSLTVQVRCDSQGRHESMPLVAEGGHRLVVEVVVVVVRDEHHVDFGKRVDGDGRVKETLGATPLKWGSTPTEHRIGEHDDAVNVEQH